MSRDKVLDTLQLEVGVLMQRVRRVIGERARALHPDLQAGSYLVLTQIAQEETQRASDLCAALSIDKAAISRQVQHLLELGFIEARRDPEDGRATLLSLSDDGARRLAEVGAQRRTSLEQRLAEWRDDELDTFVSGLTRYNVTLGQHLA